MENKFDGRGMDASSYIYSNGGGDVGSNSLFLASGDKHDDVRPQDHHELIFDFSDTRFDNDGEEF